MSFHRNRATELAWRKWVRAHEAELIACGIPREVWADHLTWWRFVDDGSHPPESNARDVRFSASDLTNEQQHRLYRFLDAVLPEARHGSSLWTFLHRRFGVATDKRD